MLLPRYCAESAGGNQTNSEEDEVEEEEFMEVLEKKRQGKRRHLETDPVCSLTCTKYNCHILCRQYYQFYYNIRMFLSQEYKIE